MESKKNMTKFLTKEELNNSPQTEFEVKLIKTEYHLNNRDHIMHCTYLILEGKYKGYRFIDSRSCGI